MIFGGAVMMSALVGTSAQMVTLASTFDSPPPLGRRRRCAGLPVGAGLSLGRRGCLSLELVRELFGVRVQQVAHFGIAGAARARCIQVEHQRLGLEPHGFLAADQHAVGALVGDHLHRRAAFAAAGRALIELVDGAHDLRGAGVVQRNDLDGLIAALIHALDDLS